ncbi:hypothetical protein [Butyrivibrio sp. YAB3001]|uniref:hypothetical protein n=1 Tax=Butyrivibrio sp. YAB3001 TaxID=1520812 RepID=UPI00113298D0|nr:hypothetical protein [Butyrivibrio sp. YAB3001]
MKRQLVTVKCSCRFGAFFCPKSDSQRMTIQNLAVDTMVKFSCAMFVGLIMALMHNSYECATWQKAG